MYLITNQLYFLKNEYLIMGRREIICTPTFLKKQKNGLYYILYIIVETYPIKATGLRLIKKE